MSVTRAEADRLIAGLAARGMVVGDGRVTTGSGGTYAHHDPATGAVQAEVQLAGAAEVDDAVRAAQAAFPVWRAMPLEQRVARAAPARRPAGRARRRGRRDQRARQRHADRGDELRAVHRGLDPVLRGLDRQARRAVVPSYGGGGLDFVVPEPYGVVGAIVPWNGPMMGMGQKAVPAIAAGNTVVAKPPELAPFGALRFAELALEAGIPPGVVNVVPGGAVAGDALVRHPGVAKMSFTGSPAVARQVMAAAAETLTPLTFELGGKSANIVFPDADLDTAVSVAAMLGAVLLSGQGCALPTRCYVHDDVYDEVVAPASSSRSRRSRSAIRSTRRW